MEEEGEQSSKCCCMFQKKVSDLYATNPVTITTLHKFNYVCLDNGLQ
uniref:Uncharacterized protein n=1 Tax=Rhizophora mucronata TaxID=61149 RepID=A0A2P2QH56_RHIMU